MFTINIWNKKQATTNSQPIIWIAIVLCLIVFILSLFIFFRNDDSGQNRLDHLGSFIGGTFGSLALFVVIYTGYLQFQQFKYTRQSTELDLLTRELEALKNDIENLSVEVPDKENNPITKSGSKAIIAIVDRTLFVEKNTLKDDLHSLVIGFDSLLKNIDNSKLPFAQKQSLETRSSYLFYSKILWSIQTSVWPFKDKLELAHDDSFIFFKKYIDLSKRVYRYLSTGNYISPNKDWSNVLKFDLSEYDINDDEIEKMLIVADNGKREHFQFNGYEDLKRVKNILKTMVYLNLIHVVPESGFQTFEVKETYLTAFGTAVKKAGGWNAWLQKNKTDSNANKKGD